MQLSTFKETIQEQGCSRITSSLKNTNDNPHMRFSDPPVAKSLSLASKQRDLFSQSVYSPDHSKIWGRRGSGQESYYIRGLTGAMSAKTAGHISVHLTHINSKKDKNIKTKQKVCTRERKHTHPRWSSFCVAQLFLGMVSAPEYGCYT